MKKTLYVFICLLIGLFSTSPTFAGWGDVVSGVKDSLSTSETTDIRGAEASDSEVIQGLKEALTQAATKSVDALGKENGFLKNPAVAIPVPSHLTMVAKGLNAAGQEELVDNFTTSLNRAAEAAVPKATPIFVDAVKSMSMDDARNILNGKDDAATTYFKDKTTEQLTQEFSPLVKQATDSAQVTSYLKAMQDKAKGLVGMSDIKMGDIDEYVTEKTLDGLFKIMADNEAALRKDPLGQSSKLLQKVFELAK